MCFWREAMFKWKIEKLLLFFLRFKYSPAVRYFDKILSLMNSSVEKRCPGILSSKLFIEKLGTWFNPSIDVSFNPCWVKRKVLLSSSENGKRERLHFTHVQSLGIKEPFYGISEQFKWKNCLQFEQLFAGKFFLIVFEHELHFFFFWSKRSLRLSLINTPRKSQASTDENGKISFLHGEHVKLWFWSVSNSEILILHL